jgi:hypothetical protein
MMSGKGVARRPTKKGSELGEKSGRLADGTRPVRACKQETKDLQALSSEVILLLLIDISVCTVSLHIMPTFIIVHLFL